MKHLPLMARTTRRPADGSTHIKWTGERQKSNQNACRIGEATGAPTRAWTAITTPQHSRYVRAVCLNRLRNGQNLT
jgi:hypothetical protein